MDLIEEPTEALYQGLETINKERGTITLDKQEREARNRKAQQQRGNK